MQHYAIYDKQIKGFKPGMSYETHDEALQAALDRVSSVHGDVFEDEEIKSQNFSELMVEFNLTNEGLIGFFDYAVMTVSPNQHDKINACKDRGLTSKVYL